MDQMRIATGAAKKLALASMLVMAFAMLGGCGGKEKRIESHLQKGFDYLLQDDTDKAGLEVRNVLQMDPKRAEAFLLNGEIEEQLQDLQRAYGNYLKVLELKPNSVDGTNAVARLFMMTGDLDKAEKNANAALALDPNSVEARIIAAGITARRGDKDGSVKQADAILAEGKTVPLMSILPLAGVYALAGQEHKALEVVEKIAATSEKNVHVLMIAAEIATNIKDMDKARIYYQRVTVALPKKFEAWNLWAHAEVANGHPDLAEKVLRDAIKANSDESVRYVMLAELVTQQHGAAAGEEELRKAIAQRSKDAQLKFALAGIYRGEGRRDEVQKLLTEIADADTSGPAGVEARNQLALYHLEIGDKLGARALLDEILKGNPRDGRALVQRARLALDAQDPKSAIIDLRAAAKDQPGSAEVIGYLAQAYQNNNEPKLARDVIADAITSRPDSAELKMLLAGQELIGHNVSAVYEILDSIVKAHPKFVQAYELKATIQQQSNDVAGAVATLNALKAAMPERAVGDLALGKLQLGQKKYEAAIASFDAAARIEPRSRDGLLLAVKTLLDMNRLDDASSRIESALATYPQDAVLHQALGEIRQRQNKLADAEAELRKSVQIDPRRVESVRDLANLLLAQNNVAAANDVFDTAIKATPDDLALRSAKAEMLSRAGRYDEAIAVYEEILKRAPMLEAPANNLAFLLTEKGDDKSIKRALELTARFRDSQNPGYLDSLGWAYYKAGQYDQAIPVLNNALSKSPATLMFEYHLGMAQYKKGDMSEARRHLKKIIDAKAQIPNADEVRRIVASV